jgi:hypothetical protein
MEHVHAEHLAADPDRVFAALANPESLSSVARRCSGISFSGDAGSDEKTPDLGLVDDLDAELLGLGGLARADAGAADQHVGIGRHG